METRRNWSIKNFVSLLLVVVMMTGIGGDSVIAIASAAQGGATQSEAVQTPEEKPTNPETGDVETTEEAPEKTPGEEDVSDSEETDTPDATDAPTMEPTAAPEETQAPTMEPTEEPEPTPEEIVVPEIDYELSIAQRPDFVYGYVQVTKAQINLYGSATGKTPRATLGGYSVLYVTERDYENNRLSVVFNREGAIQTGWIKTDGVRGLSPSDESYVIGKANEAGAAVYTYTPAGDMQEPIIVILGEVMDYTPAQTQATNSAPAIAPLSLTRNGENKKYDAAQAFMDSDLGTGPLLAFSLYMQDPTSNVGDTFRFQIRMTVQKPPVYVYSENREEPLFETYNTTVVTFEVDNAIEIMGWPAGADYTTAPGSATTTVYTVDFGAVPVTTTSFNKSFTARIKGNGTVADGTTYDFKNISFTTSAVVTHEDDSGATKTVTMKAPYTAASGVHTAVAAENWTANKTTSTNALTKPNGTGEYANHFKFVYTITVASSDEYDRYGRLDFSGYTLTETLPTTMTRTGANGEVTKNITPVYAEIKLKGASEVLDSGEGVTSLTTTTINRAAITKADEDLNLPAKTEYEVTVYYAADPFVVDFNDNSSSRFTLVNNATINYTRVDGTTDTQTGTVPATAISVRNPVALTLEKYLDSASTPYSSAQWRLYDGKAAFALTGAKEGVLTADNVFYKDGGTWKTFTQMGWTLADLFIGTGSNLTNAAHTIQIGVFPDTYTITESAVPTGTVQAADQTVEIKAAKTVKFINALDDPGYLMFKKHSAILTSGGTYDISNPAAGITFTISKNADGTDPIYSVTTDGTGIVKIPLIAGETYYLSELENSGYETSTNHQKIVVAKNAITTINTTNHANVNSWAVSTAASESDIGIVTNRTTGGLLTLTKKQYALNASGGLEGTATSIAAEDATGFEFRVQRRLQGSTVESDWKNVGEAITGSAEFTVSVDIYDASGENKYEYRIQEFDYDRQKFALYDQGDTTGGYTYYGVFDAVGQTLSKIVYNQRVGQLNAVKKHAKISIDSATGEATVTNNTEATNIELIRSTDKITWSKVVTSASADDGVLTEQSLAAVDPVTKASYFYAWYEKQNTTNSFILQGATYVDADAAAGMGLSALGAGYMLDAGTLQTTETGNVITLQNITTTGSVSVRKIDEEGAALAGATLEIWTDDGDKPGEKYGANTWTSAGGANPWHQVQALPAGTYWIVETRVPDSSYSFAAPKKIVIKPAALADYNGLTAEQIATKMQSDLFAGEIDIVNNKKQKLVVTKELVGSAAVLKAMKSTFDICVVNEEDNTVEVVQSGFGTQWNAATSKVDGEISLDQGTYYLLETATGNTSVLSPNDAIGLYEQVNGGSLTGYNLVQLSDGKYYYGPITIGKHTPGEPVIVNKFTAWNVQNTATVDILKVDSRYKGTPVEELKEDALLGGAKFTAKGTYITASSKTGTKEVKLTTKADDGAASGAVSLWIKAGDKKYYPASYTLEETQAPANYNKTEDTPRDLTLTPDYTVTGLATESPVVTQNTNALQVYYNTPKATITAKKVLINDWLKKTGASEKIYQGYPSGITIALFVEEDGKLVYLHEQDTMGGKTIFVDTDNEEAGVKFTIDPSKTYYLVEVAMTGEHYLPDDKRLPSESEDYKAVGQTIITPTNVDDFNSNKIEWDSEEIMAAELSEEGMLINHDPWTQFVIKKTNESNVGVNGSKFMLYSLNYDEEDDSIGGSTEIGQSISGDLLDEGGNRIKGALKTRAVDYGGVYWMEETEAARFYSRSFNRILFIPPEMEDDTAAIDALKAHLIADAQTQYGDLTYPDGFIGYESVYPGGLPIDVQVVVYERTPKEIPTTTIGTGFENRTSGEMIEGLVGIDGYISFKLMKYAYGGDYAAMQEYRQAVLDGDTSDPKWKDFYFQMANVLFNVNMISNSGKKVNVGELYTGIDFTNSFLAGQAVYSGWLSDMLKAANEQVAISSSGLAAAAWDILEAGEEYKGTYFRIKKTGETPEGDKAYLLEIDFEYQEIAAPKKVKPTAVYYPFTMSFEMVGYTINEENHITILWESGVESDPNFGVPRNYSTSPDYHKVIGVAEKAQGGKDGQIENYMGDGYPLVVYKYGYERKDGLRNTSNKSANDFTAFLEEQLDEADLTPLTGVELRLQKREQVGTEKQWIDMEKGTTDEHGVAVWKQGLHEGDYRLVEIKTHDDYENAYVYADTPENAPSMYYFTVVDDATQENIEITLYNPKKPVVRVEKYDRFGNTDAAFEGTTFKIGSTEIVLDANGVGEATVPVGNHGIFEELDAKAKSAGYTDKYVVFAGQNSAGNLVPISSVTTGWTGETWPADNTFVVKAYNTKLVDIKLNKIDLKTTEGLEGAKFDLFKLTKGFTYASGVLDTSVPPTITGQLIPSTGWTKVAENVLTPAGGVLTFENLEPGWYVLEEVSAPEDYTIPRDSTTGTEITRHLIMATGDLAYTYGTAAGETVSYVHEITLENIPIGTLEVSKTFRRTDGLTGDYPATINWVLYNKTIGSDGKVTLTKVSSLTRDNGDGTRTVVFADASNGFPLEIGSDGTGSAKYYLDAAGEYYIEEVLKGAALVNWLNMTENLVDPDGEETKYDARFLHLEADNYERKADFTNVRSEGKITFLKVDDKGAPLEGAKFEIYYYANAEDEASDTKTWIRIGDANKAFTSNALGEIEFDYTFTDLSKEGITFYLKETYVPSEEYAVKFDAIPATLEPNEVLKYVGGAQNDPYTIVNTKGMSIELTKYANIFANINAGNKEENLLPGAVFTLYRVQNGIAYRIESLKTGEEDADKGVVTFKNLEVPSSGNFYYAIAEEPFAANSPYAGFSLESVYSGTTLQGKTTDVTLPDSTPITLYKLDNAVAAGTKYDYSAYNTPTAGLTIKKYNANGGDAPTASYNIYLLDEDENIIRPAVNGTTPIKTGVSGDTTYTTATYSPLQPGKYLVAEVGSDFQLVYEDVRVQMSQTFEISEGETVAVCEFKNVEASAEQELSKASTGGDLTITDEGEYNQLSVSLIDSSATVEYTIGGLGGTADAVRGGNTVPYTSYVVSEEGLTYYADATKTTKLTDYEKNLYSISKVQIGAAAYTNYVKGYTATSPVGAIKADVTFYDFAGTAYSTTVNAGETIVVSSVASTAKIKNFTVSYYDEALKTATSNKYALGQFFGAEDIVVTVALDEQPEGASRSEVLGIDNKASVAAGILEDAKTATVNNDGSVTVVQTPKSKTASDTEFITVIGQGELPKGSLAKALTADSIGNDGNVVFNERLTYKLTLTNESDAESNLAIKNPVIFDEMPVGMDILAGAMPGGKDYVITKPDTLSRDTTKAEMTTDPVTGKNYLALWFTGDLLPGESISVEFMVEVTPLIVTEEENGTQYVVNNTYATSATPRKKTDDNPTGASLTDVDGNVLTGKDVLDDLFFGNGNGYLQATTKNPINASGSVIMNKFVKTPDTGDQYYSANKTALVFHDEEIEYQLLLKNDSQTEAVKDVRIVDVLPAVGDKTLEGTARNSRWTPTFHSISLEVLDATGAALTTQPTPTYTHTTAAASTLNMADIKTFVESGTALGWNAGSNAGASTTAIAIDFGVFELGAGQSIRVTVMMKAPSELTAGQSYFTLAQNSFIASYSDGIDTYPSETYTVKVSNQPDAVSVGGTVWLDKDRDGLMNDSGTALATDGLSSSAYPNGLGESLVELFIYDIKGGQVGYDSKTTQDGVFRFDGLQSGRFDSSSTEAMRYNATGVEPSALTDGSRAYRLRITPPEGFVVTPKAYKGTGGTVAQSEIPNTISGNSAIDSHFPEAWLDGDGAYWSEYFYLWPKIDDNNNDVGVDLTKNAGLTRNRTLVIEKKDEKGVALPEATFAIYGPFPQGATAADINAKDSALGAVAANATTNMSGIATVTGLDFYSSYVVVETGAGPNKYTTDNASATAKSYITITADDAVTDVTIGAKEYPAWLAGALTQADYTAYDTATGLGAPVISTMTVVNNLKSGDLTIVKTEEGKSDNTLAGAVYTITRKDDVANALDAATWTTFVADLRTLLASDLASLGITSVSQTEDVITVTTAGAEGKVVVKGLPTGTYTITETTPPDGFVLWSGADVAKNTQEKTLEYGVENTTATFTNKKITVELLKVSEVGAAPIGNVTFYIYKGSVLVDTITTGADGKAISPDAFKLSDTAYAAIKYAPGTYDIYEDMSTATGYTLPSGVTAGTYGLKVASFTVDKTDTGSTYKFTGTPDTGAEDNYYAVTERTLTAAGTTQAIVNRMLTGTLAVTKTDTYGNAVADVYFRVESTATDAEAQAKFLAYVNFVHEALCEGASVAWNDEAAEWSATTAQTTNVTSIGATAGEVYSDGTNLYIKTNASGLATLVGLPLGDYVLTEVGVPYGITLKTQTDPGSITVTETTLAMDIENTLLNGNMTITKEEKNNTSNVLAGAKFVITDNATSTNNDALWTQYLQMLNGLDKTATDDTNTANLIYYGVSSVDVAGGSLTSAATGADGKVTIKNLPVGSYDVRETIAPDGYVLDVTDANNIQTNKAITSGGVTNVTFANQKIYFELLKINEVNGAAMEGVTFKIYKDSAATPHDTIVTDALGIATTIETAAVYGPGNYAVYEVLGTGYAMPVAGMDTLDSGNEVKVATFSVSGTDRTSYAYVMNTMPANADGYYTLGDAQSVSANATEESTANAVVNRLMRGGMSIEKDDTNGFAVNNVTFQLTMRDTSSDDAKAAFAQYITFVNTKLSEGKTVSWKSTEAVWSATTQATISGYDIGATKGLVYSDGTNLYVRTAGEDELAGKAALTGLPYGDYQLEEIGVPYGIELPTGGDELSTDNIGTDGYVMLFEITNDIAAGKITINKTETGNETNKLSGAQYTISHVTTAEDNGTLWAQYLTMLENLATDADRENKGVASVSVANKTLTTVLTNGVGVAEVHDLPVGTYNVTEIKAPDGYVLSSDGNDTEQVVLGGEDDGSANFANQRIYFELLKLSEVGGTAMEDVVFNIYKDSNSTAHDTIQTNGSGVATSMTTSAVYAPGTYTVYEVLPTGYTLPVDGMTINAAGEILVARFTVPTNVSTTKQAEFAYILRDTPDDEDGYFQTTDEQTATGNTTKASTGDAIVNRVLTGGMTVTKTDDNDEPVDGVEFELTMSSGSTAAFTQYKAYVKQHLTAEANSWSSANEETINGTIIGVADAKGFIQSNGTKLTLKTDANGEVAITGLPAGTYTLTETKVPYGFAAASTATIVYDQNAIADQGDVMNFTVENELARGTITVAKKSVETMPEGGNAEIGFGVSVGDVNVAPPIYLGRAANPQYWTVTDDGIVSGTATYGAGAQFEITQVANHVVGTENPWTILVESYNGAVGAVTYGDANTLIVTTGANGTIALADVPYGEYKVTEVKASTGHALPTDDVQVRSKTIIIGDPDDDTYTTDSENVGMTANDPFIKIQLTKEDSDGEPVEGAIFEIREGSVTGISIASIQTDSTGVAITSSALALAENTNYYLVETTVPYGYVKTADRTILAADLENMRVQTKTLYDLTTDTQAEFPADEAARTNLVDAVAVGSLAITKEPDVTGLTMDVEEPAQFTLSMDSTIVPTAWSYFAAKLEDNTIQPTKGTIAKVSENVWTLTVDENGEFALGNIPYGTYIVEETAAPTGYALPQTGTTRTKTIHIGDPTHTDAVEGSLIAQDITFTDAHLRLYIEKVDENGEIVEGAKFALFEGDTKIAASEMETDSTGAANTNGVHLPLKAGTTYTLKELVPYGYVGHDVDNPATTWVTVTDASDAAITITPSRTQTEYEYRYTGEGVQNTATTLHFEKLNNLVARADLYIETLDSRTTDAITTFTGRDDAEYILTSESTIVTNAFKHYMDKLIASAPVLGRSTTKIIALPKGRMAVTQIIATGEYSEIRLFTDENGEIEMKDLPYGTYTLEEVASSTGYVLDDPELLRTFTLGDKTGDENPAEKTYINSPFQVDIYKASDLETDTRPYPLSGAKFELRTDADDEATALKDVNGKTIVLVSDGTGYVRSTDILPFEIDVDYYLVETQAPSGHGIIYAPEDFVVKTRIEDRFLIDFTPTTGEPTMLYDSQKVVNELIAGDLTVTKSDAQGGAGLGGARFEIAPKGGESDVAGAWEAFLDRLVSDATMERNGNKLVVITPASGTHTVHEVPHGTYTVTEVLAPVGYAIDTASKSVTLSKESDPDIGEIVNFTDTRLQIVVEKQNSHGGLLAGAMFEVRTNPDDANSYVAGTRMTTGANGVARTSAVLNLQPGTTYYLVETYVPVYHEATFKPFAFTVERTWTNYRIDFSSVVATAQTRIALDEGVAINNVSVGEIQVTKRSSVDEKLLPGAQFTLRQIAAAAPDAKMETRTGTTGANGRVRFTSLPYGVYTLTETKAPAGYEAREKTWTIFVGVQQTTGNNFQAYSSTQDAQRNASHSITAYNTPVMDGSLRILKIDGRDGYALSGAEFTLTGKGHDGTKVNLTGTTDANGYILFEGLSGGTYLLTETKTPSEEYVPVKYNVTITSNNVLEVTIPNWTADDDGVLGAKYQYDQELEEMGVLPVTGEDLPIGLFAGLGGGIALLGALILMAKRRRKGTQDV